MVTHQPELAIDADGQPIDIPPEVVSWRLRRVKGPGKPGLVHDPMGRPITLPLTATFQDLYDTAGPGKYIVDPIDECGRHCKEVPSGVTGVIQPQIAEEPEPAAKSSIRNTSNPGTNRDDLIDVLMARLIQTVEVNTRITELVVNRLPAMFDAASGLINAADGAKLPARIPPPMPPEPPPMYDEPAPAETAVDESWFKQVLSEGAKAFATTIAEKLGTSFSTIPLSALLDWSKAAPHKHPAPAPQVPPAAPRPSWTPPRWSAPPAWEPTPPPRPSAPNWSAADAPESAVWESIAREHAVPVAGMPTVVTIPVVAEPSVPMASGPMASVPVTSVPVPVASVPVASVPVASVPMASVPVASAPTLSTPVASAPVASVAAPSAPVASIPAAAVPVATVPLDPAIAGEPMVSTTAPPDSAPGRVQPPAPASSALVVPTAPRRRNDANQLAPTRPRTSMDDSVPMSAHIMRVYESLTLQERTLVQQLIEQLTQEEKMQWLMELASLNLPDAVARVRGVLRPLTTPPSGGRNGAPS